MPNANLVPLENVRRWPRGIDSNSSLQSSSNISTEEQNDLKKEIQQTNNFQFTSGACTKCGNFGHLTWQCQQKKKTKNVYISSNSSKEEINSLLKTNENVHTNWSISDSCISLESQKESFNERIQKLEIEKDKMSKAFEQLLEKFNEQNSLQHPSSTFSSKEFVTFDDLENHPFIQQMKEKLKLLDQKTSDQQLILEQNLNFQKISLSSNKENKLNNFGIKQQKEENNVLNDQKIKEELETLKIENKKLKRKEEINNNELIKIREEYQKLTNELVASKNLVSLLELERTQIKQQFEKDIEKIQNDANHYKSENERISDLYDKQQVRSKSMGINISNLNRINRKLKEELNISNNKINQLQKQINKNSKNVNEQTDEKFKDFGGQVDIKLETNSELLEEQNDNKMRFVKIKNRINRIDCEYTCCENKCINSNISNGFCNSKNGFVCVFDVNNCCTKIKYYLTNNKRKENKWIRLFAQNSFSKGCCYGKGYSLYYFELTMIKEETNICYAGIGLYNTTANISTVNHIPNTNTNIFLCNDATINWQDFQKFSWEDGDVFGYGIVYPARSDHVTEPYVFFTKNGSKIGKEILLDKKDDVLCPFIGLLSCSAEINFGNDLNLKPFRYNLANNT
uniref:CCHC-type domain-containing protein n=1 Tax=Meloidogyne enterolobii TaxID=390850 RepID=A0A6V7UNW8_MELEN|nr:unnamed protein product [Meloidogyne enterolobii]